MNAARALLVVLAASSLASAAERDELPAPLRTLAVRGAHTPADQALLAAASSHFVIPGFSTHAKCNLAASFAAWQHRDEYPPDQRALLSIFNPRPVLQRSIVSPAGRFRIHYDSTGFNAPPAIDANTNGIPDYVEAVALAADSTWHIEIDVLGYPAPPSDAGQGGGDECDIYIINVVGSLYYGNTNPDSVPVGTPGPTARYPCSINIDNDFSEDNYSTHGIDAARVTIAHEFFHVIQIGDYGIWNTPFKGSCDASGLIANRYFFEMSSVWMETVVYPGIKDYLLSDAPALFTGVPSSAFHGMEDVQFGITPCNDLGYSLVMFWRYAVKKMGGDATLVQRAWERSRTEPPLAAIDNTLRERGFSLGEAWCDFSHGLLFTGSRALDTLDYFEPWEAVRLPVMRLRNTMPASTTYMIADSGHAMSAVYYGLLLDAPHDTLYAVITNRDTVAGNLRDTLERGRQLTVGTGRSTPVPGTALSYDFTPNTQQWCELLTRAIADNTGVRPPFPDPFKVDGVSTIFFPMHVDAKPRFAELRIYTLSGTLAYGSNSRTPETRSGILGVSWDGRRNDGTLVHSGVYIYAIGAGADPLVGKIAVVRK